MNNYMKSLKTTHRDCQRVKNTFMSNDTAKSVRNCGSVSCTKRNRSINDSLFKGFFKAEHVKNNVQERWGKKHSHMCDKRDTQEN